LTSVTIDASNAPVGFVILERGLGIFTPTFTDTLGTGKS
jgi:hypothetical protein